MPARTQSSQDPLLRTKLHRPVVPGDFLCRPRLHNLMDLGLELPLTLVSAPAGYPRNGSWTPPRVRPACCLARRNHAQ